MPSRTIVPVIVPVDGKNRIAFRAVVSFRLLVTISEGTTPVLRTGVFFDVRKQLLPPASQFDMSVSKLKEIEDVRKVMAPDEAVEDDATTVVPSALRVWLV